MNDPAGNSGSGEMIFVGRTSRLQPAVTFLAADGLFQGGGDKFVEADAGASCGCRYVLVQSWIGADDELARERLLRLLAALLAESKIVLDGSRKGLLERGHGFALERDHVAQVGDLAMENLGVLVVFDRRLISLVCHHRHGSIPDSVRKRRTDFTAPL